MSELAPKPSTPRRHTIARDLSLGLVLTITVVFGLAGAVNYYYSHQRDNAALYAKADEIMDSLASVLVTPMWNLNTEELSKIISIYRQSGIIYDISLVDDAQKVIVPPVRPANGSFYELSRSIRHAQNEIGQLKVSFSDEEILAKQKQTIIYTAVIFALLTLSLVSATGFLLHRFLDIPLNKLMRFLEVISSGNYLQKFPPVRQAEINTIMDGAMRMAAEIARREAALEENHTKLEVLNQAILDIFSSPNADDLIRTTMSLTHKICGVNSAWFRPSSELPTEGRDSKAELTILMLAHGKIFEGNDQDKPPTHQANSDRDFTFTIRSRHREVGSIGLSFEAPPDPSINSLLKSLMSLTSLALIRQSFIRETAMMTAELQVAEAVQRSLLPDGARFSERAMVSYHYEPVLRVGGDWFSILEERGGESIFIILGDVTGHGLAQGLVTTAVAGALHIVESLVKDRSASALERPSQIVALLDAVISRIAGQHNLHMTCVAAKIDFATMTLTVCNAGHTFPLLLRQALAQTPDKSAKVNVNTLTKKQQHMLGEMRPEGIPFAYSDAEYELHRDDILLFYTDGLTDAQDSQGRNFTRKFHRYLARMQQVASAHAVKDDLIGQLRTHTNGKPVHDDICLLVVGMNQPHAAEKSSDPEVYSA